MGTDDHIRLVPHRLSNRLDRSLRMIIFLHADFPRSNGLRPGELILERVELHAREPMVHDLSRILGDLCGILAPVSGGGLKVPLEIGVHDVRVRANSIAVAST